MINHKTPVDVNPKTVLERGMHSLAWECVVLARWTFNPDVDEDRIRPRHWLVKPAWPEAYGYRGICAIPGQYRGKPCETLVVVYLDGTARAATFTGRRFTREIRRRRRAKDCEYARDFRNIALRVRRGDPVEYEPGQKGGRLYSEEYGPVSARGVCKSLGLPETYLPEEAGSFQL